MITKPNHFSPDEYRLLICNSHDSHVSAALVSYIIQKHIVLALLPLPSSPPLQPIDVGVFTPLKVALAHHHYNYSELELDGLKKLNGLLILLQHMKMP